MRMNVSLGLLRRLALVVLALMGPLLLLLGWFLIPSFSKIHLSVSNSSQKPLENVSVRLCGTLCHFGMMEPGSNNVCPVEPRSDSSVMLEYTSPTGERKEREMTTRVKRGMSGTLMIIFEDTGVKDGSYLEEWWQL